MTAKTTSLRDLIHHIVTKHHEYLKLELPRLNQKLNQVIVAHGPQDPALAPLAETFGELWEELELHMHKEEVILFPVIERYEAAAEAGRPLPPVPFGSIGNPIRMMEMEHAGAEAALRRIRELTGGYRETSDGYAPLYQGLRDLEADLAAHLELEDGALFPGAIALEKS